MLSQFTEGRSVVTEIVSDERPSTAIMATPRGTHTEEGFIPATKEYEVLKGNASKLRDAITDPKPLSLNLFSVNLISSYTLHKVNAAVTTDAQSYELINNLLQAVVCDPNNFHKLLQVLEKYPPLMTAVAEEMKEEYGNFFTNTIKFA